MPIITSEHKDLFRSPSTEDKLSLFQSLMDANELTVTLSLALLKIIHGELKSNSCPDRSVYKQYAKTIEALRFRMLDTLSLVVTAWEKSQEKVAAPPEWFQDDEPKG